MRNILIKLGAPSERDVHDSGQRDIQRKLRILRYAEAIGHVAKTCRYFGIGRTSFYRWRKDYAEHGEAGLVNAPPIPKRHANRTSPEREEKVLHLRRTYHLGPMRIVWYLERYDGIRMSDATVSRILRRNGLNRLPRGTRMRKVHTKRYNKQVPGTPPSAWRRIAMICASLYLLVLIRNLLVHLAEKILLIQPLTFGGITPVFKW